MLWSMILPFQITACLWMAAIVCAGWFAPKFGYERARSVLLTMFLAMFLFVPSCASVKFLVDPFRFGIFHYSNFDSINDWRVERYFPEAATDITLEKPPIRMVFAQSLRFPKPNWKSGLMTYGMSGEISRK